MAPTLRKLALGQWFTPPAVADLTLALALPHRAGNRAGVRVLDPSCGDGAFLQRACTAGLAPAQLAGIELDAQAADAARARVPGAQVIHRDLFAMDPDEIGRFDAVVGNPPYVRQERLTQAQKQHIRTVLGRDWPGAAAADLDRLVKRGDLAAACLLRALAFARPGARVALVVSSALLDASYAAALWRVVGCGGKVVALIDAPEERWFADAAVNALIVVLERTQHEADMAHDVRVARLRVATSRAAAVLSEPGALDGLFDAFECVAEVRRVPAASPEAWSTAMRAPAAWFDLAARAGAALVPLAKVAEVRRGVTSGANDVFYLRREHAAALGLEADVLMPLLRSPRDHACIAIDPEQSSHVALVCPAGDLERYPRVRAYLHGHARAAERPTLRGRSPWWALPVKPARLFLTKAYGSRFLQRLSTAPMVADQRVYAIYPRDNLDARVLASVLNSTYTAFALESLGRASMGDGALEWTVADAMALPIIDPRGLDDRSRRAAVDAFAAMSARPIDDIASEREKPDRQALDMAVAAAHPDLTALLDRIWPALIAQVARRNARPGRGLG